MANLFNAPFTATVIRGEIEVTLTGDGTRHIVSRIQYDQLDAKSQICGITRALKNLLERQDVGAEYEELVGYNPFEDDETATVDGVRQMMTEMRAIESAEKKRGPY